MGTKAKCHRKCARTKGEVSRTKEQVGHRKEVKPQNNLDCSVDAFAFQVPLSTSGFHCSALSAIVTFECVPFRTFGYSWALLGTYFGYN